MCQQMSCAAAHCPSIRLSFGVSNVLLMELWPDLDIRAILRRAFRHDAGCLSVCAYVHEIARMHKPLCPERAGFCSVLLGEL